MTLSDEDRARRSLGCPMALRPGRSAIRRDFRFADFGEAFAS